MVNLEVDIAGVKLKNPVTTASGTFGSGKEYGQFVDLNKLGAVTTKGVSSEPWLGNNPNRIAETYGGMLNAVGLQNPGVDKFIANDLEFLKGYDTNVIVNLCSHTLDGYIDVAERLRGKNVDLFELNISCPNISAGGITFGTDEKLVYQVVSEVKKVVDKPLIIKLSPNVTNIQHIASKAQEAGADGISLINTLIGMKVDINKREFVLANKTGGLSGPAIKPVALNMVHKVAQVVDIPIIGMGGICTYEDALEFIMVGATAVAIGTANFTNPYATVDVIEGIRNYMIKNNIKSLDEIRGILR